MSTTRLPELPLISMEDCLPYDLIRHIPGYPTEFVRQYAHAHGLAVWKAAIESAASVVESRTLKKRQARAWASSEPLAPCELAAAIRALPLPEQGGQK